MSASLFSSFSAAIFIAVVVVATTAADGRQWGGGPGSFGESGVSVRVGSCLNYPSRVRFAIRGIQSVRGAAGFVSASSPNSSIIRLRKSKSSCASPFKLQIRDIAPMFMYDKNVGLQSDADVELTSPWINWFPIAFESSLFRNKPTRHYLLGAPLVIWFNEKHNKSNDINIGSENAASGNTLNNAGEKDKLEWNVMLDMCPHRLAPLSEGRILQTGPRKGCIECPYHGWAFEGKNGNCVHIPQQKQQQQQSTNNAKNENDSPQQDKNNFNDNILSRASGISLPAVVRQGILWVHTLPLYQSNKKNSNINKQFYNDDNISNDQSNPTSHSQIDKYLVPPLEDPNVVYADYFRDLPMEWSTLIENVIDPSHLPYTHHGNIGRRPNEFDIDNHGGSPSASSSSSSSPATPLKLSTSITPDGFSAKRNTKNPGTVDYIAPSLVLSCTDRRLNPESENAFRDWNVAYAIPTLPGKCRLLVRVAFETGVMTNIPMKLGFEFAFGKKSSNGDRGGGIVPGWLLHLSNHEILEDDNVFLHYQMHHYDTFLTDGNAMYGIAKNEEDDDDDKEREYFTTTKELISYLPTDSDTTVLAFHKWYSRHGNVNSMWTSYTPPGALLAKSTILSKKELLDRKNSHTDQCASCNGAKEMILNKVEPSMKAIMGMLVVVQIWVVFACDNSPATHMEIILEMLPTLLGGMAYMVREVGFSIVKGMEEGVYPPKRNILD